MTRKVTVTYTTTKVYTVDIDVDLPAGCEQPADIKREIWDTWKAKVFWQHSLVELEGYAETEHTELLSVDLVSSEVKC